MCHKKLKFEDFKNCLEVAQLENAIGHQEKNEVNIDSLKKDHKEFTTKIKLILKSQQRFRSGKQNVFTKEINKTALSATDDKRI